MNSEACGQTSEAGLGVLQALLANVEDLACHILIPVRHEVFVWYCIFFFQLVTEKF